MMAIFRLGAGVTPKTFTVRADEARSEKRYRDAAALYREAIRLEPRRGGLHLQAGHMFKEAGELVLAGEHYAHAARLMPGNAEVALQLGHFHKVSGQLAAAEEAYRRALEIQPDWDAPKNELAGLRRAGWRGSSAALENRDCDAARPFLAREDLDADGRPDDLKLAGLYGKLAPELVPRPPYEFLRQEREMLAVHQFGVRQNTFWGDKRVARGLEAIRGVAFSEKRVIDVAALINGLPIDRLPVEGPFELEFEAFKDRIHKYSFNFWIDFSPFAPGLYELKLRFSVAGDPPRLFTEEFVVEEPLLESEHPDSDGVITLDPNDPRPVFDQVQARPSVVHEAFRENQLGDVRSILLTRTDQLGDMVASVPGMLRVRELFPEATLVCLCSPANAALVRSLGIFDAVVEVDHKESWHQRLRVLDLEEQQRIKALLAPYRFDVAVDLSVSRMGRAILKLSGARILHGFPDPGWTRLDSVYADVLHDPKNRHEIAAHSKRVLTMVERLGTLTRGYSKVIRRADLCREAVRRYGIGDDERYAVLHTGARIVWSRWAHYAALAERLVRETDLKVLLFTGRDEMAGRLDPDLLASGRIIVLDSHLPFDDFDALLSFCTVYVGNDSGPKHLAALRGVPVVSIHSSRINWSEWGQEQTGVIISRKVPCAGCHIYHDPDECGKGFACMAVGLDEVHEAVRRYV